MKRIFSLICIFTLMCTCLTCASEEDAASADQNLGVVVSDAPIVDEVTSLETITVPLYVKNAEDVSEIELAIVNGIKDVPYISLDSMIETLNKVVEKENWEGFTIDVTQDGNTVYWIRDNATMVSFDFDADTITLSDANLFFRYPGDELAMDVSSPALANEDGDVRLFTGTQYYYREGDALCYELSDYNINIFMEDGTGYIPLQTFSDVFLSGFLEFSLYNGQTEIISSDSLVSLDVDIASGTYQRTYTELGEIYYAAENGEKSDELAVFNYQELCMALDYTYGLMEEHDIDSFDELFRDTGLILRLKSNEANDTYYAMTELCMGYIGDGHSLASANSYLVPADIQQDALENTNASAFREVRAYQSKKVRKQYYPDGVPGYEEVGNTAYITFDNFVMDEDRDYYNSEITNNPNDVVELLIYANQQITRENSPIENVVIDISQNGGGLVNVALCVMSWFCGYGEVSLTNVKTGAQSDLIYNFDANLNHEIDDGDYLSNIKKGKWDLHLYCLIGTGSFSCGNMVPAFFKNNGNVTLIGRTTGGGACSVQPMSTADGVVYQISSRTRANIYKNGSFSSVDEGITPDIFIDKYEHMYDRTYLTDLINNLD